MRPPISFCQRLPCAILVSLSRAPSLFARYAVVALGRKNYLFVHDSDAGESLAGLYSLVATCEARAINPFEYLADVLARVQDQPTAAIDELLPGAWAPGRSED